MRPRLVVPLLVPLLVLSLAALAAGCKTSEDRPPPTAGGDSAGTGVPAGGGERTGVVEAAGMIVYVDLEGGFYGIVADDGTRYDPLDLDDAFREDSLRVRFRARRADVMTVRMWGIPVRIEAMTRAPAGP